VADIELVLFDVGGVLGTNGWDTGERGAAIREFSLDHDEFERRHHAVVDAWESGAMSFDDYLTATVFDRPRPFTRDEFRAFMLTQSVPNPPMLALAGEVASSGRYRMMTLNNESATLHRYRVRAFGLSPLFSACLVSCYLAARKPWDIMYERALGIAHADPARTVFIDDRPENLAPAAARGVHTVHATDVAAVRDGLARLGVVVDSSVADRSSLNRT